MKKYIAVSLMAILVFVMSVSALAEQEVEQSTKFIEVLASELQKLLAADNLLGTPIETEGVKIIPVVGRGFGFGGGSGAGGDEKGRGTGTGAGAGGGIMPVSFLVITKGGEVQIISAKKGAFGEIMKAVAPMIMEAIKSGKQPQEAPPTEEKPEQPEQE